MVTSPIRDASQPGTEKPSGFAVDHDLEALREAARKVDLWIKCGMPDQSDNTPTRDALKRDLRAILSTLLSKGPKP